MTFFIIGRTIPTDFVSLLVTVSVTCTGFGDPMVSQVAKMYAHVHSHIKDCNTPNHSKEKQQSKILIVHRIYTLSVPAGGDNFP